MARLPEYMRGARQGEEEVSRELMSSHQRERVIIEATGVFAKRGYQGTTVDDLLAAGRIGVTNFYGLFEGKEACFLACFERVVGAARERIAAAAARGDDWSECSYLALREAIFVVLATPLESRLVLIEAQSAGEEALGRYNRLLDEAIEALRAGRGLYPASHDLPPGFEQASVSGLAFYLQQCLLDSRRHSAEELTGETAALVLEPIVGAATLRAAARAVPGPA